MRIIYYIFFLFLIISCNNVKSPDNPNLFINARIVRSFDTVFIRDTIKHKGYDIKLSMVNKSLEPISFWIMTCSWQDNFIINTDYLYFLGGLCNHNYPRIKTLKSNDSAVFNATIVRLDYTIGQCVNTTRFGFIYLDSNTCKNEHDFGNIIFDKSKHKNIIWSNPLYLNDRE